MSTAVSLTASNPRNVKPQIFGAIAIAKNGNPSDLSGAIPFSAGSGAPSHNAHVAGEIYIRTDGTAAAGTLIYAATNTSGTWAPIVNLAGFAPTVISLTDNAAAALDITEATNSYLKFTTTNGAEKVTVSKALALLLGLDLSGAASVISIIDNTAAALDISEGANVYLRCVTTNGSEAIVTGKPLLLSGGLAPGSKFTSTEQTGTGSSQNIAHGLGSAPSLVWWAVSDSGATGIYTAVPGVHDATNVKMTVTSGVKFYVFAIK